MVEERKIVLSEDPHAGLAAPVMDLIAAGVLAAISLWFMIEALRLPAPGGTTTAPGLLPFLTAASLMVMALILGADALTRRRNGVAAAAPGGIDLPADWRRTAVLAAILAVYVLALEFAGIEVAFELFGSRIIIGSFEVTTAVVLTAILRIYWQAALWTCVAVAVGWVALLSLVFRLAFHVPLP
jgi:hypothetical protein